VTNSLTPSATSNSQPPTHLVIKSLAQVTQIQR